MGILNAMGGDANMKTLVIDPPSDKQKLFLKANTKHIAFGGA